VVKKIVETAHDPKPGSFLSFRASYDRTRWDAYLFFRKLRRRHGLKSINRA
jgi:hypothetical protein